METRDTAKHGNRYSDDVKERAYQLWAFMASRRISEVARMLESGEIGEPVSVSTRQLQEWCKDHEWSQRVSRDLRAIAPDLREQTIGDLVLGALDGARYLRSVVDGRETKPQKERVTSAIALLDKAGFSHVGNQKDPASAITSTAESEHLPELNGLSVNELMSVEATYRTKR